MNGQRDQTSTPLLSPRRADPGWITSWHSLRSTARGVAERIGFRWVVSLATLLFGILLTIPVVILSYRGWLIGADWAEYLFTGPAYLGRHAPGIFGYPWPLLPVAYLPLSLGASGSPLLEAQVAAAMGGPLLALTALAGYRLLRDHTGSRGASLLGATALAAAPLLQAEIGWGGQAQLVAYALGMLALWSLIARALPRMAPAYGLLSGALLSLASFAETYATVFFVLTASGILLAGLGRGIATRRGAIMLCAFSLPVGLSATITLLSDPLARHPTGNPFLLPYLSSPGVLSFLWRTLTFGSGLLAALYVATMAVYIVHRFVTRYPSPASRWLVPSALGASLLVGAILTPAMVANRAVYPLTVPAALALAEMAAGDSAGSTAPRPLPRRWKPSVERARGVVAAVAIASVVIVGVQVAVDVELYPQTLQYYAFADSFVSELAFLQHESGAILYDVAPIDHAFVTQWATEKSIYAGPAFQPYTATTGPEQATVRSAWALSFGELWTNVGPYTIDDSEPASGGMAPGVILDTAGFITPTIASDDQLNSVAYSTPTNLSRTSDFVLSGDPGFHRSAVGGSMYPGPGFNVARSLSVDRSDVFHWNYTFQFSTAVPRGASIVLTSPVGVIASGSVTDACGNCSNSTVSLSYYENALPPVGVTYDVAATVTNGSLTTTYVPHSANGLFQLEFAIAPTSSSVREFELSLAVHPSGLGGSTPISTNESTTVNSTGIAWAVASWASDPIVLAHLRSDPLFSFYRATSNYEIFTVA